MAERGLGLRVGCRAGVFSLNYTALGQWEQITFQDMGTSELERTPGTLGTRSF